VALPYLATCTPEKGYPMRYVNRLTQIQSEYNTQFYALAEEVRTKVIIPICRRYHLTFTSGMGYIFFTGLDGMGYGDPRDRDFPAKLKKVLTPVFDLLNHRLSFNDCFGYYVADVRKEDLP
jgi:hypothetical protein